MPKETCTIVKGLGASKGTYTGIARRILDPDQLDTFQKGDVLVCTTTDPDWIEAFERAGAVVTGVGSLLCHAAVVAREYKLPCVVGIGHIQVIPDGAKVTVSVEGMTGEVRIDAGE